VWRKKRNNLKKECATGFPIKRMDGDLILSKRGKRKKEDI